MQGAGTTSTPARLVQDVQTRWNSSFYVVKRLLTEKRALCAYAADRSLPATLSANEWGLLEKTDRARTVRGVVEENQLSDLHCSRRHPSRHRFKTSASRREPNRQRHQNNEEHTPPSCQQASKVNPSTLLRLYWMLVTRTDSLRGEKLPGRQRISSSKRWSERWPRHQLTKRGQGSQNQSQQKSLLTWMLVLLLPQVRLALAVCLTKFWRNMMNLLKVPRQQLSRCKCT
ncbi:uncharacterized protein [Nothobranchius furzeri]|uniref:uncharacterized protein n=1 Tax=Nothobranchius furzeri TaxID=105023 RepID=UPI003904BF2C